MNEVPYQFHLGLNRKLQTCMAHEKTLYPEPWALDPATWTLNPEPWTLDPGPWTLDPGP